MAAGTDRRTPERLRHHYEVEKEIADRLRASRDPTARARIFATMYDELFARVPDHPRLAVRRDLQAEARQVERLLRMLRPYLHSQTEYVEFGAGACALAFAVAPRVRRVRVVEIADQIPADVVRPGNFELVLYDGFTLDLPDGCADLVFSEQFVEHLHPEDAERHFALVHRILRPGGCYLLRTPERWTGPHDISRWFSDVPQGFHLREWSHADLVHTARRCGYRALRAYWTGRGRCLRWPLAAALAVERGVAHMPRPMRRTLGHKLLPMVALALVK